MEEKKCKKCGITENVSFEGMCKKCYEETIDKAFREYKKKKEENEKKVKENSNDSNMKLIRFIKRQMFNNRRNICYINYYFYIYKHCQ